MNLKLIFLRLLHCRIHAFLHFTKCRIVLFLYSLNRNNLHELNKMNQNYIKVIENNFGLQKSNYPCEHTLEKQRKSCDDLKRRIHELETEML